MSLAVEKVSLDSNEGDNVTVSVVSRGLAYSSQQKFALVITGNVSVSSGACNVTTWPTPLPTLSTAPTPANCDDDYYYYYSDDDTDDYPFTCYDDFCYFEGAGNRVHVSTRGHLPLIPSHPLIRRAGCSVSGLRVSVSPLSLLVCDCQDTAMVLMSTLATTPTCSPAGMHVTTNMEMTLWLWTSTRGAAIAFAKTSAHSVWARGSTT